MAFNPYDILKEQKDRSASLISESLAELRKRNEASKVNLGVKYQNLRNVASLQTEAYKPVLSEQLANLGSSQNSGISRTETQRYQTGLSKALNDNYIQEQGDITDIDNSTRDAELNANNNLATIFSKYDADVIAQRNADEDRAAQERIEVAKANTPIINVPKGNSSPVNNDGGVATNSPPKTTYKFDANSVAEPKIKNATLADESVDRRLLTAQVKNYIMSNPNLSDADERMLLDRVGLSDSDILGFDEEEEQQKFINYINSKEALINKNAHGWLGNVDKNNYSTKMKSLVEEFNRAYNANLIDKNTYLSLIARYGLTNGRLNAYKEGKKDWNSSIYD